MNDAVLQSQLQSISKNFPSYQILGGFTTDKNLLGDLYYLYTTISDVRSKVLENKNKFLLLIDAYSEVGKSTAEVYNWHFDENVKSMVYKHVNSRLNSVTYPGSDLSTNFANKEELYLNLRTADFKNIDEKKFADVFNAIKASSELKQENINTKNAGTLNLKKQINLSIKYLTVIDEYLNNTKQEDLNFELLAKIESIVDSITSEFNAETLLKSVRSEFTQSQVVETLTSLINLQVGITEKLNKTNA